MDNIQGTNEADSIKVTGSHQNVSGGEGNDTIFAYADGLYIRWSASSAPDNYIILPETLENANHISGDNGDDSIVALGADNTLYGGNGNDYIHASGRNVVAYGENGDDTIVFAISGALNAIYGGDGNDSIEGRPFATHDDKYRLLQFIGDYGGKISLYGGAGNDTIRASRNCTIIGGEGDDVIYSTNFFNNSGILIRYEKGDGNDTINNFSTNATLQIADCAINSIYSNAFDVVVEVDSGSIVLYEANGKSVNILDSAGNLTTQTYDYNGQVSRLVSNDGNVRVANYTNDIAISGSNGNDTIINNGSNVTIDGGDGLDKISNYGENAAIYAGDGEDSIYNYGDYDIIYGGAGNDHIRSEGANISIAGGDGNDNIVSDKGDYGIIYGGAGNDSINNSGSNATIYGGAGDDTISSSKNAVILYNEGDGNDVISSWNDSTELRIYGSGYSTMTSVTTRTRFIAPYNANFSSPGDPYLGGTTSTITSNHLIINVGEGTIILENVETKTDNEKFTKPQVTTKTLPKITLVEGTLDLDDNVNSPFLHKDGNNYTYSGGDEVLENYQQDAQINLAADFTGISFDDNNFYVNSSSGRLAIQNARDKFISYGDATGNFIAHSYMASGGGEIDRRESSVFEVIIGGNNADNQIYAGAGGSSVWGGVGGSDVLTGGDGYDEFFYAVGDGNDVIQNAGSNDLVNLSSVNLSQITGVEVGIGQVNINFIDGGNLQVNGGSEVKYKIAEGTFAVNQSTGEWTNA